MDDNIKNCPFCGGDDINIFSQHKQGITSERAVCNGCGGENDVFKWQVRTGRIASASKALLGFMVEHDIGGSLFSYGFSREDIETLSMLQIELHQASQYPPLNSHIGRKEK